VGSIELGGGGNLGKIHQFIHYYYFSADSQNEIKSFDTAIDQSIAEVLPGGLRRNVREGRFAIVGGATKNIKMASKQHEKRNNQPKTSGLDRWEMEWD
jgi:hypothetical protein